MRPPLVPGRQGPTAPSGGTSVRCGPRRPGIASPAKGGVIMTETTLASQAGRPHRDGGPRAVAAQHPAVAIHGRPGRDRAARRSRPPAGVDPNGREIVISCGAALFGLRLAVRSLGRQPDVELLPERPDAPPRPGAARPGRPDDGGGAEAARPRCRTGTPTAAPSSQDRCPTGCWTGLRDDARAEGATLVIVDSADARAELASIAAAAGRSQAPRPGGAGRDAAVEPRAGQPGQGRRARARLSRRRRGGRPGRCRSATSTWTGGSAC